MKIILKKKKVVQKKINKLLDNKADIRIINLIKKILTSFKMTKIFDSCTHPTLTGKWGFNKKIKSNNPASFEKLNKQLIKNNYYKACAIGFDNFEI